MLAFAMAILLQAAEAPAKPIVAPAWIKTPSGDDFARYYPESAMKKDLSGRTVMDCQVLPTGMLNNCKVTEEFPVDEGFGEATLRMAPLFRMLVPTTDNVPREGVTVRIPIRFVLPGGRQDELTTMLHCYGASAAALERNSTDPDLPSAVWIFAAQVAKREIEAKATPAAFESALTVARTSAAADWGKRGTADILSGCQAAIRKSGASK